MVLHLTKLSVALYSKQVNIFFMIIPVTLFFGAIGYLYYKSKDEVSLVEVEKLDTSGDQKDQDDLYKDLEDLFI